MMNTKILKYELFTLFFLTIITLVVFYYRDTLPDNYLSISSASSSGFFSYYVTSFLNFINYYSGPWVFVPCAIFTSFYVLVFSKRADWIDALNIFSLSIFSLLTIFYFQPSLLGAGLYQILDMTFSAFSMFLVWAAAGTLFLWGAFRGGFTEKVQQATSGFKNFDYKAATAPVQEKFLLLKDKFIKPKAEGEDELEEEMAEESMVAAPAALPMSKAALKAKEAEKASKEEVAPILLPDHSLTAENAEEVKTEAFLVPITEAKKVEPAVVDEDEMEEHLPVVVQSSHDDDEYVDESEISIFKNRAHKVDSFDDDQYYNLVKLGNTKKETKFHQPDEKYFHDIISKIQAKLGEFKIQGQIINVLKGPVVDTFEWELGPGEKVSRLTSIAEDLSLALSGSPIRMVYPMKGRTTVGIEVPRNPRDFIFLDEIIGSKDFTNTSHHLPLAMGKDAFGEPVVVDLAAMPHMLVAGSTGAGKSVFINSVLVSLLIKKSPNQMKLILIDPKQLELALYSRLPHLLMPVITEPKTAATSLLWACQEMDRRYTIMSEFGVRNIEGFNHKLKNAQPQALEKLRKHYEYASEDTYELPFIVIIVDEFADLILSAKGKEIETQINRLAAKARAAGIHLIVATQRPSVDVITGVIKSNFPTRVSFRVTSSQDSRTILNAMGAEKLLGKGDMLYKYGVDTTRIHSAFIDEAEIEALADKLSEMTPEYNPHIMEFLENGGEEEPMAAVTTREGGESSSGGRDDKYDEAVRVVLEHRSASASLLQRRLGVGYNRAANLIEEMEAQGVVGPAQGSKPRKVLMGSESLT
ncbi:cell division protein FtsK [Bacteriovorax stolpii]|uniref:Cell division protein FtsK n=1 Tax=Bacteriovorax stolpii TaxID=960 RepID=A0A2K9NMK4_BACTC|nr:DNA translocase FtsK [Bacteriovorax stolpii]AUN96747.1 cell division protein FtsK [Bacteriovorax stolpii]TDP53022.1 S-DNA-T family DNA segregation ATPase FtsK/SpoIIIE [Bacteriovorax stolpii]